MADEFDYMSDDFIKDCAKNDVRPGLIKDHSQKRDHELLKKKRAYEKASKERMCSKICETKRRKEGLTAPLSSDNKGFAMMQKMGFSSGMSLGKSNSGITEPVPIVVKSDRQGLGRLEAKKRIKEQKEKYRLRRVEPSVSIEEFRRQQSRKSKEREIMSDLFKSRTICQSLDTQNGIEYPEEKWFWVNMESDNEHEEEEENKESVDTEEFDASEKLELITTYLRHTYCYCVWCGVQYEDETDLTNCPGSSRDEH